MSADGVHSNVKALKPEWSVPARVHAAFTLRTDGVSQPPFDSLNLGAHVGDAQPAVAENRRRVRSQLLLPAAEPHWLEQVHGADVLDLDSTKQSVAAHEAPTLPIADAAFTREVGRVCAVQVADCLPVLFAATDGSVIAAAHAGWRGLAAGILEATVKRLDVDPAQLLAWLGPGICRNHFEVGAEVRAALLLHDASASAAFTANPRGRWQCDLLALARRRLIALGITQLSGGSWCTYADSARFFSFRRDGRCGRMAALIWLS